MATTAVGVKGSDVYTGAGVGDPRVVLSVKAVRGSSKEDLASWQDKVLALGDEGIKDAAVMAFQTRDVRGGKGERDVFYHMLENLDTHHKTLTPALMELVPEYGGWMDVFKLMKRAPMKLNPTVLAMVEKQLAKDELAVAEGRTTELSLLAKWLPREGNKDDALAATIARHLWKGSRRADDGAKLASYRKRVSALNKVLQTVETFECANRWDEIDPKRVPAKARELKKYAYLNEKKGGSRYGDPELRHPDDPKRMACREHFQTFFSKAAKGEVKISGAETLYPHQIVEKAEHAKTQEEKDSLNAVWLQMVAKAREGGGLGSSIAMCDFSGSMMSSPNGDTPYWVSKAFGLLIAAANSGPFQGQFMGFSTDPEWLKVNTSAPLTEQVASLNTHLCQGLSTDFQKAMDKVLGTLKAMRVRPGEEPKNLIVITDMGFDAACGSHQHSHYTGHSYRHHVKTAEWQTHIEAIRESFKRAGEDMWGTVEDGGLGGWQAPRIVIWNVAASYTDDFHATANQEGVAMLAGWSPSLFKVLCEEGPKAMTPYDILRAQLDAERYEPVRKAVSDWLAGGWRGAL